MIENEIVEPANLAKEYGWESFVAGHNSEEALTFYKTIKLSLGIVLGARILSKKVIDSFSNGIINFHPGVLPENRGLDNLKWAIFNNLPQGVTTHFIDENIDVGFEIYKECIDIDAEDSPFDVNSKAFDLQITHLNKLISSNFNIENTTSLVSHHNSQKAVSDEIDDKVFYYLRNIKNNTKVFLKTTKNESL